VVLLGEFATDIPRAWLLKINDFQMPKFPIFLSLRASNQGVGGSNPSGRTKIFLARNTADSQGRSIGDNSNRQTLSITWSRELSVSMTGGPRHRSENVAFDAVSCATVPVLRTSPHPAARTLCSIHAQPRLPYPGGRLKSVTLERNC
jgi:hypothetical protein